MKNLSTNNDQTVSTDNAADDTIDWQNCHGILTGFAAVTMAAREENAVADWLDIKFVQ